MTVAARLRSALRDTDTVARLSGDEFVVILTEHDDQQLSVDIVQRLMDSVAQPVMLGSKEFFVTCSIGVAVYPTDGAPADSLIEHADIAMYRAKKLGRNNFQFYTPAMNEEAMERVRIESALRNALERNEFVLHYQPQVDLASGEIVGMEALIRWQHPEMGMVAPSRFIGVAEETGLIVPIGAWVMRTACLQNQAWQQAGLGKLRVAVNLSARQFGAANLVDRHPRRAGRDRPGAGLPRDRTDRKPVHERRHAGRRTAAQHEGAGREPVDRRLRHRLFEPVLPVALPDRRAQDRPLVRRRDHARLERRGHRRLDHRAGAQPEAGGDRRRASKRRSSSTTCGATAATRCRATTSAGRCRRAEFEQLLRQQRRLPLLAALADDALA